MDQFVVHDLFADDFMSSHHQAAPSVQPAANALIQNTAASQNTSTNNGSIHHQHSDFSFFNGIGGVGGVGGGGGGGIDTGFLQPHSHDLSSVIAPPMFASATTVNNATHNHHHQSSIVTTTTAASVQFSSSSQKSGLFSDDHFMPVSSAQQQPSVLTTQHHFNNHAIDQQTLDPFQESGLVKQEHSYDGLTVKKEEIKEEAKEELLSEAQAQEMASMTTINNVVCTFNTKSHLNLKRVATEGRNVIYKRENNMVNLKLRRPKATASIWSSGKITCTGTESEEEAHIASRRIARQLQKLGFRVRFANYKVVNVLGTCFFPFAVSLNDFSAENRYHASYEPELHPAVTYKLKDPKATLKIFSTGSITVTAPRVSNIHAALKHVYPLCYAHQLEKTKLNPRELELAQKYLHKKTSSLGKQPIKSELHHGYAASSSRGATDNVCHVSSSAVGGVGIAGVRGAHAKSGYQQFRYSKRAEEEDSTDVEDTSDESCYGEDSDSN